jgi:hypothetical protein
VRSEVIAPRRRLTGGTLKQELWAIAKAEALHGSRAASRSRSPVRQEFINRNPPPAADDRHDGEQLKKLAARALALRESSTE